jgi:pimeloyl-ACP methyl ester carboxylesterase
MELSRYMLRIYVAIACLVMCSSWANSTTFHPSSCFLQDCSLWKDAGEVEFRYLTVAENRDKPDGRKLRLAVVILKALEEDALEDPILYLDGGPGGNTLANAQRFQTHYLRKNRDIILTNFRGLGYSEPDFCKWLETEIFNLVSSDYTVGELEERKANLLKSCFEELQEEGIDLLQYNNPAIVKDLEELRKSLGIVKWNLYGISYGTRLAQTYLRDHPQSVRSAILDSPVPVNEPLPGTEILSYRSALHDFFKSCEANEGCNRAFPNLENYFYETLDKLKNDPLRIPFKHALGGEFVLNYHDAHLSFHQLLYSRDLYPTLPWLIKAIDRRDIAPFVPLAHRLYDRSMIISNAMYILGTYHDYALLQDFQLPDEGRPPGNALAFFQVNERIFNEIDFLIPDSMEILPFDNNVPSLVLTGSTDPITPPHFGEKTAAYLGASQWLDFPGVGHGVTLGPECARHITAAFVDDPLGKLDVDCIEELRANPVDWVNRMYYNPRIGLFAFTLTQEFNPLIISIMSGIFLLFLSSLIWGLVAWIKGRATAETQVRQRNLLFRGTGLLFLIFVALLANYIFQTAENHGILIIMGLVDEARWLFFLSYPLLFGVALLFIWYIQAFPHSNIGGRLFYGLAVVLLILWSTVMVQYGMFP